MSARKDAAGSDLHSETRDSRLETRSKNSLLEGSSQPKGQGEGGGGAGAERPCTNVGPRNNEEVLSLIASTVNVRG